MMGGNVPAHTYGIGRSGTFTGRRVQQDWHCRQTTRWTPGDSLVISLRQNHSGCQCAMRVVGNQHQAVLVHPSRTIQLRDHRGIAIEGESGEHPGIGQRAQQIDHPVPPNKRITIIIDSRQHADRLRLARGIVEIIEKCVAERKTRSARRGPATIALFGQRESARKGMTAIAWHPTAAGLRQGHERATDEVRRCDVHRFTA